MHLYSVLPQTQENSIRNAGDEIWAYCYDPAVLSEEKPILFQSKKIRQVRLNMKSTLVTFLTLRVLFIKIVFVWA
jgi:hypothetical protein